LLGPLVQRRPDLRSPGAFDAFEVAVRAIVGQGITVAAARTILTRLAERGLFCDREALAAADPASLPLPRVRAEALIAHAAGAPLEEVKGVGPWTLAYVAMRLGDPDVLLHTDAAVRNALAILGGPTTPREIAKLGERWSPVRSYATHHLWA
jgi:AraC family transcriptional regulator of adaptative response / DNA-3-methyladenine glycosylase II